jgi:hypothetical protein
MKKSNNQFPVCDSCGRHITGESHKIASKATPANGMIFHKDPLDCAKAPEVREIRKHGKNN